MTENDIQRYRTLARLRVMQIADEDRGIRRRLSFIRVFGWPLFVVGIVCPLAAGSVGVADLLGGKQSLWVVVLSFAGAVAVALHRALGCDAYQDVLRRTAQSLRGVSEAYEAVCLLPDDVVLSAFQETEDRLRKMREASAELPVRRRRSFQNDLQSVEAGHL